MQRLKDMSRFQDLKDNVFLLLDDDFNYYSSDGDKGNWRELPYIIESQSENQEIITTLPYKNSSLTFLCFMKPLKDKVKVESTGKSIAYVMLAGLWKQRLYIYRKP